jgi:hypothetical protein
VLHIWQLEPDGLPSLCPFSDGQYIVMANPPTSHVWDSISQPESLSPPPFSPSLCPYSPHTYTSSAAHTHGRPLHNPSAHHHYKAVIVFIIFRSALFAGVRESERVEREKAPPLLAVCGGEPSAAESTLPPSPSTPLVT